MSRCCYTRPTPTAGKEQPLTSDYPFTHNEEAALRFALWPGCCLTECDTESAAGFAASPAALAGQSSSSAPKPLSLRSPSVGGQMDTAEFGHGEGGVSDTGDTLCGRTLKGVGLCLLGNGRFHCTLDILRSSADRNIHTLSYLRIKY